ncbi:unnamed protein product [Mycena citricolor]|uniref:Uncharacterized protein n=1 Tax=Mycena citricolor TaxID=2018698 RepID=A0AAD2HWR7_9AGAR|nr:unnamed protein product [Mycena citricolor]
MSIPPTPPSPGVGVRRKGPKILPRLPLSAFSPPNSGTSERFPLPPSPSAIHPELIIDAHILLAGGDLSSWRKEAGSELSGRIGGVVVGLPETDPEKFVDGYVRGPGGHIRADIESCCCIDWRRNLESMFWRSWFLSNWRRLRLSCPPSSSQSRFAQPSLKRIQRPSLG